MSLLSILSFVVVFGILIIVHELGHYVAALSVGVHVKEFGVGIPPKMVTLGHWRGTEFTLNWLPIGGFVRPAGEDDFAVEGGLAAASKRARIIVLAAGSFMNFLLAIVLFTAMYVIGEPVPISTVSVAEVAAGSIAADAGLQQGDIVSSANGTAINADFQLNQILADNVGQSVDLVLGRGDEVVDISISPIADTDGSANYIGATLLAEPIYDVMIRMVEETGPAAEAGLQENDMLLAANGAPINTVQDMIDATQASLGEPIALDIMRQGQVQTLEVTPRTEWPENQGPTGIVLGRNYVDFVQSNIPFGQAFTQSFRDVGFQVRETLMIPVRLIRDQLQPEEARLVSIKGIYDINRVVVEDSVAVGSVFPMLQLAGFISVALAIANLLPLPALDGGRIMFVIIEAIRGKRIPAEREGFVHAMGMALLLLLMVVLVVNDIVNPII